MTVVRMRLPRQVRKKMMAALLDFNLRGVEEALRTGVGLNPAIQQLQMIRDSTPADHPERASCSAYLCTALEMRFDRLGRLRDLDAAIDAAREAVAVAPTALNFRDFCG